MYIIFNTDNLVSILRSLKEKKHDKPLYFLIVIWIDSVRLFCQVSVSEAPGHLMHQDRYLKISFNSACFRLQRLERICFVGQIFMVLRDVYCIMNYLNVSKTVNSLAVINWHYAFVIFVFTLNSLDVLHQQSLWIIILHHTIIPIFKTNI